VKICLRDRRVVSLAVNLPGPLAAAELRDLGASVVKIEPPSGDPFQAACPPWYAALVAGMEVERLDLKSDEGRARLGVYLDAADLLLTSSRPASLERLGLCWPDIRRQYPRLGWVAIVGYGEPRQHVSGHDLTYQAAHGLVRPGSLPNTLISDIAGAKQAVIAALALLLARERGDGAAYVEVALEDGARLFAEPLRQGLTGSGGVLGGGRPDYNLYRSSDGWVAVAALEDHFRVALEAALGVNSRDAAALAAVFATRPARDWQIWAEARDLPIVAVRDFTDLR